MNNQQHPKNNQPKDPTGYGYGYGYDANYAVHTSQDEPAQQKGVKDYLLILWERIWYILIIFLVVLTCSIVYTIQAPKVYTSTSQIQILRDDTDALQARDSERNEVLNTEDLNTQIQILGNPSILTQVRNRLTKEERQVLMEPYENTISLTGALSDEEILFRNRSIQPQRQSLIVNISYRHPDKELAAKIANLFAEEFISFKRTSLTKSSITAANDLDTQAKQFQANINEIENRLSEYRKEYDSVSLNFGENIAREELTQLSTIYTRTREVFDDRRVQWELVQKYLSENQPLWNIGFIANQERVARLLSELSSNNIEVESLKKRYKSKHPTLIRALQRLNQTESELTNAVTAAASVVEAEYQAAKNNFEQAQTRLKKQEKDMLELEKVRIPYNQLVRDRVTLENQLAILQERRSEEMTRSRIRKPNVVLSSEATPAIRHSSPREFFNIAAGTFGGLGLGIAVAFGIALLDDRIKTSFDIEVVVGLPIIGVIPRIGRFAANEKSSIVASGHDPKISEAFRSIYSSFKLKDNSSDAKVIVITSSIPGEGKSFVSTNLALTFAAHGEKTLIIDADLRMPNVAKSLNLGNEKGLISFFENQTPMDDIITSEIFPNLDLISTGGQTKNATQILSCKEFPQMIEFLREHYDRIIIDSPPLGAVSDTLMLLPHVDGVMYVMRFNTARKKAAKGYVQKIKSSDTPIFGGIMNGITSGFASYYYSNYYDYSHTQYYNAGTEETKPSSK